MDVNLKIVFGHQDLFLLSDYSNTVINIWVIILINVYLRPPELADFLFEVKMENKRIAVAAIVIDEQSAAPEVNKVLHEYSEIIIGRMGIPYKERGISLISVALDAEPDVISSLTGRLGRIGGVSVKAAISKK